MVYLCRLSACGMLRMHTHFACTWFFTSVAAMSSLCTTWHCKFQATTSGLVGILWQQLRAWHLVNYKTKQQT